MGCYMCQDCHVASHVGVCSWLVTQSGIIFSACSNYGAMPGIGFELRLSKSLSPYDPNPKAATLAFALEVTRSFSLPLLPLLLLLLLLMLLLLLLILLLLLRSPEPPARSTGPQSVSSCNFPSFSVFLLSFSVSLSGAQNLSFFCKPQPA